MYPEICQSKDPLEGVSLSTISSPIVGPFAWIYKHLMGIYLLRRTLTRPRWDFIGWEEVWRHFQVINGNFIQMGRTVPLLCLSLPDSRPVTGETWWMLLLYSTCSVVCRSTVSWIFIFNWVRAWNVRRPLPPPPLIDLTSIPWISMWVSRINIMF